MHADAAPRPTWLWLFLYACSACSPQGEVMLVSVSNLPARATTLSVNAMLDGKSAMSGLDITQPLDRFALAVTNLTGHLTLDVQALDSDRCIQGIGETQTDLPSMNTSLALAITAQSPRKCGALPPCAAGSICPVTPKPQTQALDYLWATSPSDVWAVGAAGTIVHFDGTRWSIVPSGVSDNLIGVWASGPNDVWVVGDGPDLLHYDGKAFTPSPPIAYFPLYGVFGTSKSDVWAVGGGMSVGTNGQELLYFNGAEWSELAPGNTGLNGVWASSPTDVYVVGVGGVIMHSNNGTTFSMMSSGISTDLTSVWGLSPQQIFAAGKGGVIIRYDGVSWGRVTSGVTANFNALFGDATNLYAVGSAGTFLRSTAPFSTFTAFGSGTLPILYGVQTSSNGIGWIVGQNGYIASFDTRP